MWWVYCASDVVDVVCGWCGRCIVWVMWWVYDVFDMASVLSEWYKCAKWMVQPGVVSSTPASRLGHRRYPRREVAARPTSPPPIWSFRRRNILIRVDSGIREMFGGSGRLEEPRWKTHLRGGIWAWWLEELTKDLRIGLWPVHDGWSEGGCPSDKESWSWMHRKI